MTGAELRRRRGLRPRTHSAMPHTQLDQQPDDPAIREELGRRCFSLPDVEERQTIVSVPGARALWLEESVPGGLEDAFMRGREFAHLHPAPDLSLHLKLPEPMARAAIEAGWAEFHPLVESGVLTPTSVMVYAPRDAEELETVWSLVEASYRFARGEAA